MCVCVLGPLLSIAFTIEVVARVQCECQHRESSPASCWLTFILSSQGEEAGGSHNTARWSNKMVMFIHLPKSQPGINTKATRGCSIP